MSELDKQDQRIRQNAADLDTLWARMRYMGKTDYKVEWDGNTPVVYWRGHNLGSVASLNNGSMEQLADILDRARKQERGENK